jgi:hypothetical protein
LLCSGYGKTAKTARNLRRLVEKHAGLDVARYGSDMIIWGVLLKVVRGFLGGAIKFRGVL